MTWYEVLANDGQDICWVWMELVEFKGNLDAVPVRPPEVINAPVEEINAPVEENLEPIPQPTPTCSPNQNCK